MSRYIVTGGDGFIGSKIVQAVKGFSFDIKSGHDVIDYDDLMKITSNSLGIFHCAAKISVPESFIESDVYFHINVEGTKSVIKVAEEEGVKIVFSSSAAVYGESGKEVSENSDLTPKSPYAENKRDGEELLRKSSIPHIALRYFNIYGPGQSSEYAGVVTKFIVNALKGIDLVIYGNGEQVRDFIFVEDVVRANVTAMNYSNKTFDIFNIASGEKITINQLASMIIELTNSSSKIRYEPARQGDITYSACDVSKARDILGWQAEFSLEDGLRRTIASYVK